MSDKEYKESKPSLLRILFLQPYSTRLQNKFLARVNKRTKQQRNTQNESI